MVHGKDSEERGARFTPRRIQCLVRLVWDRLAEGFCSKTCLDAFARKRAGEYHWCQIRQKWFHVGRKHQKSHSGWLEGE